jgi:undecaprenyl diphosphate synthase
MDGNGRWAKQQHLSRIAGHRAGLEAVREAIQFCSELGIEVLSLFAFSSENWRRPTIEVKALMDLFASSLKREVSKLHSNNIKLQFIGDRSKFNTKLQQLMAYGEELTANNTKLNVVIAVNYGGRWDVLNTARYIANQVKTGALDPEKITEELFTTSLSLGDLPEPDLFIRTSGEQRISNFFLWQLAYTELYFSNIYWPDFNKEEFQKALDFFASRKRRFGGTDEFINDSR